MEDGWRVVVACPGEGDLAGWVREAGAAWYELPLSRQPAVTDAAVVLRLRQLLAGVDVVHLHSSKAGAVGRAALATMPPRQRPKSVFTPHAWSWLVGGRLAPIYQWVERRMAGICDTIVAVSDAERDVGTAALGPRAAGRIVVIPNGVDLDRFSPVGPSADRPAGPLIVCVARLAHQKGQDIAIRSLGLMRTTGATLRLVGAGPDAELRTLAAELGVADRVEFAGPSPDPSAHVRAADVVVVPSRWDGLSLSLLEAMACGRPVVASAVPGSEAVDGAGLVVAVDDPRPLAEAIDRLLDDPDLRGRLGQAGRARATELFDQRRRMAEVVALWGALLEERSSRAH